MDANGRVMLPVGLRKQFAEMQMDSFVLKPSIKEDNLEMYPPAPWKKMMKKINGLNPFVEKNMIFKSRFLAGVRHATIDATGRLLIPKDLIKIIGLEKDLVIAGELSFIRIWDRKAYDQFINSTKKGFPKLSQEVMGEIDFSDDDE